jgi:hypothetical protein
MAALPDSEDVDEKQMLEALRVLNQYYTRLAREASAEILEAEQTFEEGSTSSVRVIVDKYAAQLGQVGSIYHLLKWKAPMMRKPEGLLPLARTQFRCFACGGVIEAKDTQCRICGWTWY